MALDDTQKMRILRFLCYPYGTLDNTSLDYSKIVSDKLAKVDGAAQVEVEQLISWIDETDDQIDKAINSAGVKSVDDIEFFGDGEGSKSDVLRRDRGRYLSDLSALLGIPSMCRGRMMGKVYC